MTFDAVITVESKYFKASYVNCACWTVTGKPYSAIAEKGFCFDLYEGMPSEGVQILLEAMDRVHEIQAPKY